MHTTTSFEPTRFVPGYYEDTIWGREHKTWTVTGFVMDFTNMPVVPGDPNLINQNECWPHVINAGFIEAGFALRTDDQYYWQQNPALLNVAAAYRAVPPPQATGMFRTCSPVTAWLGDPD